MKDEDIKAKLIELHNAVREIRNQLGMRIDIRCAGTKSKDEGATDQEHVLDIHLFAAADQLSSAAMVADPVEFDRRWIAGEYDHMLDD